MTDNEPTIDYRRVSTDALVGELLRRVVWGRTRPVSVSYVEPDQGIRTTIEMEQGHVYFATRGELVVALAAGHTEGFRITSDPDQKRSP